MRMTRRQWLSGAAGIALGNEIAQANSITTTGFESALELRAQTTTGVDGLDLTSWHAPVLSSGKQLSSRRCNNSSHSAARRNRAYLP